MGAAWERMPAEPPEAYAAFVFFRELPSNERSLEAAAAVAGRDVAPRGPPPDVVVWERQFRWVDRAQEWDSDLRSSAGKYREMLNRHSREAVAFQHKLLERLRGVNLKELDPGEMIRW